MALSTENDISCGKVLHLASYHMILFLRRLLQTRMHQAMPTNTQIFVWITNDCSNRHSAQIPSPNIFKKLKLPRITEHLFLKISSELHGELPFETHFLEYLLFSSPYWYENRYIASITWLNVFICISTVMKTFSSAIWMFS